MRIATSGTTGALVLAFATSAAAQGAPAVPAPTAPAPAAAPAPAPAPPAARKGKEPAHPDAPPTPPPPGLAPAPPAPAPAPVFTADATAQTVKEPPLAGWHGSFFLRDPNDYFRLYPRGRMQVDLNTWPGGPTGEAKDGGVALQPRLFVKRLRFELAGQFLTNWTFHFAADFGGQATSNNNGKAEQSAAAAGTDPTKSTARYSPVEAASANAALADVFLNYSVCKCLNFMAGQYDVAFSMENRTSDNNTSFMERSIGIGGFVIPSKKDTGLTVWGELFDGRLDYAVGVLTGDGQNRPQIDSSFDFTGRVFTRPLFGSDSPLAKAQLGLSARTGQRDPKFVGYDYPAISTNQGYQLWQPTYKDSLGRTIHVLPSGSQNAIGGELRLPVSMFDLRAEAYYVQNNTREAVDGYQLGSDADGKLYTERLGAMSGVGWYVHLSAWPLGDRFVNGDPGNLRPTSVNFAKEVDKPKQGLEVSARVSGVNAEYQGASRQGAADGKTATLETGSKITVFQYGLGLTYWYTRNLRLSLNYDIYNTPGSGAPEAGKPYENRAVVVANTGAKADPKEHMMHELGARVGLWF